MEKYQLKISLYTAPERTVKLKKDTDQLSSENIDTDIWERYYTMENGDMDRFDLIQSNQVSNGRADALNKMESLLQKLGIADSEVDSITFEKYYEQTVTLEKHNEPTQ